MLRAEAEQSDSNISCYFAALRTIVTAALPWQQGGLYVTKIPRGPMNVADSKAASHAHANPQYLPWQPRSGIGRQAPSS
ncbi:hypothetical protein NQ317_015789 [Molorchus minor]|uniref:Uncharacterized protein n=1 Tax=Molorchus minor TaxID=1323400 RepID=A0ABQ9J4W2_9CUCU|nr:hypothetical protein NQ317_015789 [Molorchus minor]